MLALTFSKLIVNFFILIIRKKDNNCVQKKANELTLKQEKFFRYNVNE